MNFSDEMYGKKRDTYLLPVAPYVVRARFTCASSAITGHCVYCEDGSVRGLGFSRIVTLASESSAFGMKPISACVGCNVALRASLSL